ncbi:uncharacterized protein LOC135143479 [Zophobas morio]|uniref:uncharacterized protein LOC135143479 n=1 Tax=Zophobas morio TaxID=2755281 RepID=UPI0030831C2E
MVPFLSQLEKKLKQKYSLLESIKERVCKQKEHISRKNQEDRVEDIAENYQKETIKKVLEEERLKEEVKLEQEHLLLGAPKRKQQSLIIRNQRLLLSNTIQEDDETPSKLSRLKNITLSNCPALERKTTHGATSNLKEEPRWQHPTSNIRSHCTPRAHCFLPRQPKTRTLEHYYHTCFLSDLNENVSENDLTSAFVKFGKIRELRVIRAKRIGFVTFENAECVRLACDELNGSLIANVRIHVTPSKPPSSLLRAYNLKSGETTLNQPPRFASSEHTSDEVSRVVTNGNNCSALTFSSGRYCGEPKIVNSQDRRFLKVYSDL